MFYDSIIHKVVGVFGAIFVLNGASISLAAEAPRYLGTIQLESPYSVGGIFLSEEGLPRLVTSRKEPGMSLDPIQHVLALHDLTTLKTLREVEIPFPKHPRVPTEASVIFFHPGSATGVLEDQRSLIRFDPVSLEIKGNLDKADARPSLGCISFHRSSRGKLLGYFCENAGYDPGTGALYRFDPLGKEKTFRVLSGGDVIRPPSFIEHEGRVLGVVAVHQWPRDGKPSRAVVFDAETGETIREIPLKSLNTAHPPISFRDADSSPILKRLPSGQILGVVLGTRYPETLNVIDVLTGEIILQHPMANSFLRHPQLLVGADGVAYAAVRTYYISSEPAPYPGQELHVFNLAKRELHRKVHVSTVSGFCVEEAYVASDGRLLAPVFVTEGPSPGLDAELHVYDLLSGRLAYEAVSAKQRVVCGSTSFEHGGNRYLYGHGWYGISAFSLPR